MTESRQYDLVLFGATGYTGKLTAEHIATSLPTDLKWALAGRSAAKLEAVAADCKSFNADRVQPGKHYQNPLPTKVTWRKHLARPEPQGLTINRYRNL
jgi:hypothetical protein